MRILLTTQPFYLAVGDTHAVAIGVVIADLAALQSDAVVMETAPDLPGLTQFVSSLGLTKGAEHSFTMNGRWR